MTRGNHLPTCSQWCAINHCPCGRPALHGMSTCGKACPMRKEAAR